MVLFDPYIFIEPILRSIFHGGVGDSIIHIFRVLGGAIAEDPTAFFFLL